MLRWDGHPIEAVLLDLDDTILDNQVGVETAKQALAALLAERLGDVAPGAIEAAFEAASEWFWKDDERHRWGRLDMARARRAVVERLLEGIGRPDPRLAAEGGALYTELRDASYVPFAGALESLARLRARTGALGLVTNGDASAQRAKIDRLGVAHYFDVIVVEGELGVGKPDRRVFAHALGALGAAPEAALMAGDNYVCDVLGALDAGLHAVWIDPHGRPETPRPPPRPHRTLASFVELAEALGVR
jgi:putative hydrolase of the HAD superfamily